MSNIRSPSPTHNTSTINTVSLGTSRSELYEKARLLSHSGEGSTRTPARRTHSFIHHYHTEAIGTHTENSPGQLPSSKRMRMQDSEERSPVYTGRSSPS